MSHGAAGAGESSGDHGSTDSEQPGGGGSRRDPDRGCAHGRRPGPRSATGLEPARQRRRHNHRPRRDHHRHRSPRRRLFLAVATPVARSPKASCPGCSNPSDNSATGVPNTVTHTASARNHRGDRHGPPRHAQPPAPRGRRPHPRDIHATNGRASEIRRLYGRRQPDPSTRPQPNRSRAAARD